MPLPLIAAIIANPAASSMYAMATVMILGGIRYIFGQREPDTSSGRKRSLSFSSEVMLKGAFPDKAKVHQPVINALFYVKVLPTAEVCAAKMRGTMYFDRMRSGAKNINGTWTLNTLDQSIDLGKDIIITKSFPNEDSMREFVDRVTLEEIPLIDNKPLWRFYRLVNEGSGRNAVLVRIHHVIGDGVSLVGIMGHLFEKENGDPFSLDIPEKMGSGRRMGSGGELILKFARAFCEVATLPSSKYDTDNAFISGHNPNMTSTHVRQSVEFPSVKLEFIKKLKNAANVTVNDILMAATSGMIRRYCIAKGDPAVPSKTSKTNILCRSLMPVAFPRPRKDMQSPINAMRNIWSFVSVPMAVNESSAKNRVYACADITTRLKSSPHAIIQLFLQNNIISLAPKFIQQQIAFDAFSRHSMVFSNLPGPAERISFCGEPVLAFSLIFPNLLPQVIIMSYAGDINFTMSIDPQAVDTKILPQLYLDELCEQAEAFGIDTAEMLSNNSN